MKKVCAVSGQEFEITDEDVKFYEKMDVPAPTLCPKERRRRRLAWRSDHFFLRTCDKCHKKSFSWFSGTQKNVKTYCETCFQSDEFDAMEQGMDFDFSKPFFENFSKLQKQVPRHISNAIQNENSEYIISAHKNKNCYFADEIDFSRDCYFGYNIQKCENIVESLYVRDSEIGYKLLKAEKCYSVFYSKNVFGCVDSAFLMNCRGCKNCLFCANIKNKEYHIFNKPVSKEEYEKYWNFIFSGSRENVKTCEEKFSEFMKDQIQRGNLFINTENCSGDYITNSKNCHECFLIDGCQDCKFCRDIHLSRDCYDTDIYEGELFYEVLHGGPKGYKQLSAILCWFSSNIEYCIDLRHCKNCFGCAGLKKKEYCIFNKQYSKEEYFALREKIMTHMKETKEWGEFFPMELSPTPYNYTQAAKAFPLTQEEALEKGLLWEKEKDIVTGAAKQVPKDLGEELKTLAQQVFLCEESGRKFKFVMPELQFYKKWNIPLPAIFPQHRLDELWKQLDVGTLYNRTCDNCHKDIETRFAPETPHKVYCEKCYLESVE